MRNILLKSFLIFIFSVIFLNYNQDSYAAKAGCWCYCVTPSFYQDYNASISDHSGCMNYCKDFTRYSIDGSISGTDEAGGIPNSTGTRCTDTSQCCLSADSATCTRCSSASTTGGARRLQCVDPTCASKIVSGTDADADGRIDTTGTTSTTGTASTTSTTDSSASVSFTNPLQFNTVEDFLGGIMSAIQKIIVILALVFITIGAVMILTSAGDSGMLEKGKAAITMALVGFALAFAAPSLLKELANIIGWGDGAAIDALTLSQIGLNVLNFLLGVMGVLALIMLVLGASMYLTSAGDEDRIDKGKDIVKYSLIGVALAMGSMVLVKQIAQFFI